MKRILSVLITLFLIYTLVPHQPMLHSHALDSEMIVYPEYDERIPRCYVLRKSLQKSCPVSCKKADEYEQ